MYESQSDCSKLPSKSDIPRNKLRGEDEPTVDMVDELLEYLDGELPKANENDVERVLDQAAPVLAALLVPMKQKYDRIVEIKEEVTEAITEVVPVEELVQDYEETLDDLKDFCKHISEEVETNWQDNLDELHRKLWELESSMSEIEDISLSSFDNSVPCPAKLRRQLSELDREVTDSPDLRLKLQAAVGEEAVNGKNREYMPEVDKLPKIPLKGDMPTLTPPERFQSPTLGMPGSSPTINIIPSHTEISPVSSRSLSPIQFLNIQNSFGSLLNSDRAQSPNVFYSACPSRRQSQGNDLISRYVSFKHPQLFDSEQFKDFASRRSSLNYGQTLYDLSHCDTHSSTAADSLNRRYMTRRQNALSILVDYVRYRIGLEKICEGHSPVGIEKIREEDEVQIKITRSSVSSDH